MTYAWAATTLPYLFSHRGKRMSWSCLSVFISPQSPQWCQHGRVYYWSPDSGGVGLPVWEVWPFAGHISQEPHKDCALYQPPEGQAPNVSKTAFCTIKLFSSFHLLSVSLVLSHSLMHLYLLSPTVYLSFLLSLSPSDCWRRVFVGMFWRLRIFPTCSSVLARTAMGTS